MYKIIAIALSLFLCTTASANGSGKQPTLELDVLGTYQTGIFDESAAEVVAHDPRTLRLFVVNAGEASVDVLDISDPTRISKTGEIAADGANSVAVNKGIVAIALEAGVKQDPGYVAFYDANTLRIINQVQVGALPDMVTFTPNGRYVLTANEGEPNDDYTVDPEGSISIINISKGVDRASVKTADFQGFNKESLVEKGVRIFGPDATAAQDLEPEYIAVSHDSKLAWVTLQENNALALVDFRSANVQKVIPLGFKNHNKLGKGIDASNRTMQST